jgi:hypothetical protein
MTKIITIAFCIAFSYPIKGQNIGAGFQSSYAYLKSMLEGEIPISFKDAVFATENTYLEGLLKIEDVNKEIVFLVGLVETLDKRENLINYTGKDKAKISKYASIYKAITDSLTISVDTSQYFLHPPFRYDFDDIFGSQFWENMFVSKLLATRKGNCHSLPYLYKMICEAYKIPCHLALAPNHIYIKHRAEKGGWYNTELTSASFPIDAWLMASGYISLQAVQNGIYLDTLSEKESIALCVLDLAQGYDHKYPDNDGKFISECCDLALKHFPDYVNAILLKAETRLKQLQAMQKEMKYAYLKEVTAMPEGKAKWDEMNSLYMQLYKLGYRQMPEQMYVEWLTSLKTEKEKYRNKNAPGATKD